MDKGVVLVHTKGQRCRFGAGYDRGVVLVHTCILYYLDSNIGIFIVKKDKLV